MSDFLSSLGNVATPGAALGALGLGVEAVRGNQKPAGLGALTQQATQLGQMGQQLGSGALPAGAQAGVTMGSEAAKARVRQQYASSGLSGSTMEAQALSEVDQQAAAQQFQMSQSLIKEGMQASGISAGLFDSIMKINLARDDAFSKAISNFAAALGGAGG